MSGKKERGESKVCPVCNARISRSRYAGHMRRVHGDGANEGGQPRAEGAQKGKRAERRKAELARKRRSRSITVVASALFVLAVGGGIYLATDNDQSSGPEPVQPPPPQTQTTVTLGLSALGDSAQFYTYNANGVNVRYFAAVGSDGNVHVALDACDVCYSEKKGYRQLGGVMKCNNCGKEFAIVSIGTENLTGGCWPSFVPISIDGSEVVIQISSLSGKRFMFQ